MIVACLFLYRVARIDSEQAERAYCGRRATPRKACLPLQPKRDRVISLERGSKMKRNN
jgi:hypothetical protein